MIKRGVQITRKPICGNALCLTSTSIAGFLTHGWGQLDYNGHWEHECPEQNGLHKPQDDELCRRLGRINGELDRID